MRRAIRISAECVTVLIVMIGRVSSAQPTSIPDPNFPITDGPVYAAVETNGTLFIGGRFSQVGPVTGAFAGVSQASGNLVQPVPYIFGSASCSIEDSQGGVYFGGLFSGTGASITNVGHLTSDGAVDTNFSFDSNGQVDALILYGDDLFVGGNFTSVNGQTRTRLAAVDRDSGALKSFSVDINGPIKALAVNDDTLYIGGSFSEIGGSNRNNLAAIDLTTGLVSPWDPSPNSIFGHGVVLLVVDDGRLYVAGDFNTISGANRNGLAAFDVSGGGLLAWDPQPGAPFLNLYVRALAVSSNVVYLGGGFESLGGQPRGHLGAVDKNTGNVLAWNPGAPFNDVHALAVSGNTVYAGGDFPSIGVNGPPRLAALDASSGAVLPWTPSPGGTVLTLLPLNGVVYVGGAFASASGVQRELLAAIDLATGQPKTWDAKIIGSSVSGDAVYALEVSGDALYVGGRIRGSGGKVTGPLMALSPEDAALLPFEAELPSFLGANRVFGICAAGTNLVVTLGAPNPGPVIVSAATGQAGSWSFNPPGTGINSSVNTCVVAGDTLYVGGDFSSIAGQPRSRLAAFEPNSGQLLDWQPKVEGGTVAVLAARDQSIFAWGNFTKVNGHAQPMLAVLDAVTGSRSLGPAGLTGAGEPRSMRVTSSSIYLGGGFTQVNGIGRTNFAAIDLLTGELEAWDPKAETTGILWNTIVLMEDAVGITGGFASVGGQQLTGIARFPVTNPPPSVQILSPTNGTMVHAPATLPLEVHAASASGTLTNVEVYVTRDLLLSTADPMLATNWIVPKHFGDYLVTAVAYDEHGQSTLSPMSRVTVLLPSGYVAPTFSITFPSSNATYAPFSDIEIQTSITNPSSAVESVQFLLGTNLVAVLTNGLYSITLSNMSPGDYSVGAILQDEYGVAVTNSPVPFHINHPPQIGLQQPHNGMIASSNTSLLVSASASDADGFIQHVTFLEGTNIIAIDTNAPFSLTWTNPPAGYYDFSAVATDNFGSTATSSVAKVTIYPAPQHELIIDNTNAVFSGIWSTSTQARVYFGSDFRFAGCSTGTVAASAVFTPDIPVAGLYDVYIWYPLWFDNSTNSQWHITHEGGTTNLSVNQIPFNSRWNLIASGLHFEEGTNGYVRVSNDTGEGTNRFVIADAVRLTSSTVPFVLSQPSDIAVKVGMNATFTVNANGSGPLYFQWVRHGTNIPGATSSSLSLTKVQAPDAGLYSVVVSNALSTALSLPATLTVLPPSPPQLTTASSPGSGMMHWTLTGNAGVHFIIEYSTNLSDWSVLTNAVNGAGSVDFSDIITNDPARYYRARWP